MRGGVVASRVALLTVGHYHRGVTETRSKKPSAVRRRRRPGESRLEILDQVVELLWDRPIRDLSIVTIMRGTGLSRPAFYQYFKNIPVLIEELLIDLETEMNEAEALDSLKLERYCCRRMLLTHVDLIEKLLSYNTLEKAAVAPQGR